MAERAPKPAVATELPPVGRRPFLVRVAAVVIGAVVGVVPLTVGLLTFLDPLVAKEPGASGFASARSIRSARACPSG